TGLFSANKIPAIGRLHTRKKSPDSKIHRLTPFLFYPQYNGSMERAQREIKKALARHVKTPNAFLAIQSEMDIHELNHRPRSDLGNQTPCSVFRSGENFARSYTLRKRKEVYESIREKTLAFAEAEGYDTNRAWRRGVRTWLQEHRFITVTKG
ncbi:hypothetical protein P4C99_21860, partial [Pontiellaceae bacterium B1224]|nr:hypothetical protein [Pontiellaceae bacterium B1224]